MAFNEGSAAELLQAGARGCQGLARALRTSTGVLGKGKNIGHRGILCLFCYNVNESLTQIILRTSLLVLCSGNLLFCCSAQGGKRRWSWSLLWVLSLNSSMTHASGAYTNISFRGSWMHRSPSGETAGLKLSLCKQHARASSWPRRHKVWYGFYLNS